MCVKLAENLKVFGQHEDEQIYMNNIEIEVDISKNHISLLTNELVVVVVTSICIAPLVH